MHTKRTHLGRAIYNETHATGRTQTETAQRAGIQQGSLSCIISGRRARPDVPTLRALCAPHVWPDRAAALAILLGHLRDEVERAGYPDGTIDMHADGATSPSLNTAAMVKEISDKNPTLGAHLSAIVQTLYKMMHVADQPARMVAERSEKYTPRP